ncbi:MAG: helix-turn-helix domain-containing protein [Alphaproteobacteria bacterium]
MDHLKDPDRHKMLLRDQFELVSEVGTCHITLREYQCIQGIKAGKTYKEIAREMGVSPRSVESYLQRLKVRSGLQTRAQLFAADVV